MGNIPAFGANGDYWSQFQPQSQLTVMPNSPAAMPVSTTPYIGTPGATVSLNGAAPVSAQTFADMAAQQGAQNPVQPGAPQASSQPPAGGFTSVSQFVDWLATKYPQIAGAKQYYIDQITSHLDPAEAAALANGGVLSAGTIGYWSDPNSLHVEGGGSSGGGSTGGVGGFSGTPFTPPTGVDEQNDPGYQFALQQGEQGILRNKAAVGNLRTGGTLKDLAAFDIGTAQQDYNNVFNRALNTFNANSGQKLAYDTLNSNNLLGLSSQGLSAANTGANAGAGYANANSNLYTGQGNAQGAGSIAQGNTWSAFLSGLDPQSLAQLRAALA